MGIPYLLPASPLSFFSISHFSLAFLPLSYFRSDIIFIYDKSSSVDGHTIIVRNGKIVWKQGPYYWCFRLNLKCLGWPYRAYIKVAKNDFEAVFSHFLLLWPWCQVFWGSLEDRYRWKRVSQMLLVCYNLLKACVPYFLLNFYF